MMIYYDTNIFLTTNTLDEATFYTKLIYSEIVTWITDISYQ
jgi:hypothetical protein